MFFEVEAAGFGGMRGSPGQLYLVEDNWNDWYTYTTAYDLKMLDSDGYLQFLGSLKIGQLGLTEGRPSIPPSFDELDDRFFSVGQHAAYYENLNELDEDVRSKVLSSLRDIARDQALLERVKDEDVTRRSLLRSVPLSLVTGNFRYLAHGESHPTPYDFSVVANHFSEPVTFKVIPDSLPPTNIHVLIGRNGVGKTHLLKSMVQALRTPGNSQITILNSAANQNADDDRLFANLIFVSFSAFDRYEEANTPVEQEGTHYSYVGLMHHVNGEVRPKAPEELEGEFVQSLKKCRSMKGTWPRWKRAIEILESDPNFREVQFSGVLDSVGNDVDAVAAELFSSLSSGHKTVLLSITRLVEITEERTLVLIDEPEVHLHPPLLSSFVRALSDLLMRRNGVAVIATHSPVVLQEVPKRCVWLLFRTGSALAVERPQAETFGENIGSLTSEVFRLEVTESGFQNLIRHAVDHYATYDEVMGVFDSQLGMEARSIARALIAIRDREKR